MPTPDPRYGPTLLIDANPALGLTVDHVALLRTFGLRLLHRPDQAA